MKKLISIVVAEFWNLGYKLFKDSPESFTVPFLPGDVLDQSFLTISSPFVTPPPSPAPLLKGLTNLTPLKGHLSAIHAAAFFHLFDEPQQLYIAKALAGLLSPEPGSIIFGWHRGELVKGGERFNHSADSWNEMWEKEVFKEGQVRSWAILKVANRPDLDHITAKIYLMEWCVTRL